MSTWVSSIMAGCFECHGGAAAWTARNAQAVAARHHQATGHATWCDAVLTSRYGELGKAVQLALFEAHEPGEAR